MDIEREIDSKTTRMISGEEKWWREKSSRRKRERSLSTRVDRSYG